MDFEAPLSCPLPSGPLNALFKGARTEPERQQLRDEMRNRLHPITCRICRQELAYFRDVGRFPLEEDEVQGAYLQGRGYRFLLTVWWARVSDHLAGELREMPAVSSYYRHMSFHLGVRTEREHTPSGEPSETSFLSRSGGFARAPVRPAPAPAPAAAPSPRFPTIISVPMPEAPDANAWAPTRVETPRGDHSVLRMAKTMVQLSELSNRRVPPDGRSTLREEHAEGGRATETVERPSSEWLGRAAGTSSGAGGYTFRAAASQESADAKRRRSSAKR